MSTEVVLVKDVIRNRRIALKISQERIVRAVGIHSAVHLSMMENGKRSVTLDHAVALADALRLERMDFCKLVLFERCPGFYAALYGPGCPSSPRVLNPRP